MPEGKTLRQKKTNSLLWYYKSWSLINNTCHIFQLLLHWPCLFRFSTSRVLNARPATRLCHPGKFWNMTTRFTAKVSFSFQHIVHKALRYSPNLHFLNSAEIVFLPIEFSVANSIYSAERKPIFIDNRDPFFTFEILTRFCVSLPCPRLWSTRQSLSVSVCVWECEERVYLVRILHQNQYERENEWWRFT